MWADFCFKISPTLISHSYRIAALAPRCRTSLQAKSIFMFDQASNSLPHVRSGRLKVFAVTSKARLTSAPTIPTADEVGLPDFHVSVWHGMWVPKGTPRDVVER